MSVYCYPRMCTYSIHKTDKNTKKKQHQGFLVLLMESSSRETETRKCAKKCCLWSGVCPLWCVFREIRNVELLKLRFGESHMHYCEVMLKVTAV